MPLLRSLALVMLSVAGVAGIDLDLSPDDVDRALALGRRGESSTAPFHMAYVRTLDQTTGTITVRQVEVLTPYRRLVLHAEARRRLGDYVVSRADVEPLLGEWRLRVSVVAAVRFHPQNVLTSLPPIEVQVRDPVLARTVEPLDVSRKPITNAGTRRPLLGSTIETIFDGGLLAHVNGVVVVTLRGEELARASIDFRAID